jgi:apolipoprotein N-acyltransferase
MSTAEQLAGGRAAGRAQAPRSHVLRVARLIILSYGWRRAAIAFSAGAASALAMAPFSFSPILFVTFPVLVWLLDGVGSRGLARVWSAATVGWFFGFGYFLAGLYWVGIAFLVDVKTFGWLMPFAVVGLPAWLGVITAFGTALASLLWVPGPLRIFALASALTISEWMRGYLLTGFPWNAFGYALAAPLPLAQVASLVGLWGLTFLAVAIFASPATLADSRQETRHPFLPLVVALLTLVVMASFGLARLAWTPTEFVDGVRLRIMQPNLSQDEKFNYRAKKEVMARYLALSERATGPESKGLRDVTHLIWPESAFPFLLAREPDAVAQIADALPPGTVLVTGAARTEQGPGGSRDLQAYNSIYVIDHDGAFLGTYDKVHLVPFGEYLPFQRLLERMGLMQLTKVPGGFLPGGTPRPLTIPGAPSAQPFICYEIIFPDAAKLRHDRPHWLLNLTNDGWFGDSTGPHQHFQQAQLRAIEQGLPLVRAANTGISAVVDGLGRPLRVLPLGVEGILDAPLPKRQNVTVYARFSDIAAIIAVFVSLIGCLHWRLRGSRS